MRRRLKEVPVWAGLVLAAGRVLSPDLCLAAEEGFGLASAGLKMIGVLALVVGLLLGCLYLLRRLSPALNRGGLLSTEMRLLGQYPLGPKRILALVKVGSRTLLLGVTEANINLLTEVQDQDLIARLEGPKEGNGAKFGRLLRRARARTGEGGA